jgi:hypothetical protein
MQTEVEVEVANTVLDQPQPGSPEADPRIQALDQLEADVRRGFWRT